MQILRKPWFWLSCVVAISAQAVYAQPPSPARSAPVKVGHVPVATILQRLGAKLERGSEAGELESYASHFDRMDTNRDGKHTRVEYVDKGGYMTPQARAGIFRAADGNADGVVTKAEYVLNRVITDEAKAIVQGMDDDEDGLVERAEFVKHAAKLLSDRELAEQVFAALDANADGGIPIPEYLRVWGQWARAGRAGPGAGPPGVDEIFERFDRNKDGKLQKNEVPKFAQRFILRADADGNDVVTREELELSRQRQRPGGRPAGDWPQFHGPRRNNISTDKGLLKTWPEGGPSRLWEAAGIGEGFSTVSIVGKRIYTAGAVNADCVITALDMDGKEVWTRKNGKAWNRSYPGTRSTPTIAEGLLYHLSGIGNLMCLKADSGARDLHTRRRERQYGGARQEDGRGSLAVRRRRRQTGVRLSDPGRISGAQTDRHADVGIDRRGSRLGRKTPVAVSAQGLHRPEHHNPAVSRWLSDCLRLCRKGNDFAAAPGFW